MVLSSVPNILTLLRCVLAFVCAGAVLLGARASGMFRQAFVEGHSALGAETLSGFIDRTATETGVLLWPMIALGAFLLAAITDYADGVLARLLNAQSAFGAWLDPIADKFLVGATLVALSIAAGSIWLSVPTSVIVLRDIYITSLRARLGGGHALPVIRLAKWKTATEMLAIACLLLAGAANAARLFDDSTSSPLTSALAATGSLPLWSAGLALTWISAALSVLTGSRYAAAAREELEAARARVFD